MSQETNIQDKYWLNNKQVVGSFGAFILLGIGYGEFRGMQANDHLQDVEIELIQDTHAEEEKEMKGLIYRQNKETKEYLNKRINSRVDPLEAEVMDLIKWKSYQEGLQAGRSGK